MWKAICWFFTAYPTAHGALTRTIIMMCHLRWKLYLITNISIQFSQVIYNSTQDRSHLLIRIHLWLFCKHLCSYISEVSKIFCFFLLINETFPWAEHRLDTKPLQFCVWNLEEKKKSHLKVIKYHSESALMALEHVHANIMGSALNINEMWWLKVAAPSFSINIPAASEAGDH